MKANELMIGDWVLDGKKPAQIAGIMCDDLFETTLSLGVGGESISPIPLTAEILEKNGFVKMSNCPYAVSYMWSTGGVAEFADVTIGVCQDHADKWRWDCLTLKIHLYKGDIKLNKIRYVHQLQHALRLCNIDKEIEI